MRLIPFALVCLPFVGRGRRVYSERVAFNAHDTQSDSSGKVTLSKENPLLALSQLFFTATPASRFASLGLSSQAPTLVVRPVRSGHVSSIRHARARSHALQMRSNAKTRSVQDRSSKISLEAGTYVAKDPPDFSVFFLIGAAALWGTYPTTIKLFFSSPGSVFNAGEVSLIRFLVMGAASYGAYSIMNDVSIPSLQTSTNITWSEQLRRRVPNNVFVAAGELGAIGAVGSFLNTQGLQQIPGLTGAILLTFLNVFTPLTAFLFGATEKERSVDRVTCFTSLVALGAAIFALLPDALPSPAADVSLLPTLGGGEGSVLIAAFFFAANKVRLSSLLKVHDAAELSTGRLVAQAGLAAIGLGLLDDTNLLHELLPSQQGGMGMNMVDVFGQAESWLSNVSPQQIFWIVVSSLLSGAIASWCQANGQVKVSAPKAQLFYSTSPIFAALWARLLLQEPITNHEIMGGSVLLLGICFATLMSETEANQSA